MRWKEGRDPRAVAEGKEEEGMKIARVFPTKTSMSPLDQDSYFDGPDLFTPKAENIWDSYYDEIHISVSFTWDIEKAYQLKNQWEHIAPVKIGGFAINGEPMNGFKAGQYLRKGITITSRGCLFRCPWCMVRQDLIELQDFPEGHVVQDNNFLACSSSHKDKVFQMLSHQSQVDFRGGLDSTFIDDETVERLRGLRIADLWLSYDYEYADRSLKLAVDKLAKYFRKHDQIRCYVLIGYKNDSIEKAEKRLIKAWEIGALPFAMLYRDKDGSYPKPEKKWRQFQRSWARPAAIKTMMKGK